MRGRPSLLSTLVIALAGFCAACTVVTRPARDDRVAAPLVGPEADAEGRAFLMMISDRRFYEPFTVRRLLISQPSLRPELALALGRIGHPSGRVVLESLLEDLHVEVRREAAFALGLLEPAADPTPLLVAVGDPDREVGQRALEALARHGRPLADVVHRLAALDEDKRWHRLLPVLFRFQPGEIRVLAERALTEAPAGLHRWAAYALGRRVPERSAESLRALLTDPDPWLRGWAARGLAAEGDRSDLPRLRPLLSDLEAGPAIHALRSARALISSGRAAPPADWVPTLERLLGDPRPGVRQSAIEASAAWLRDPVLSAALWRLAHEGSRRDRELAIVALASGRDPRAADLIAEAASGSDPVLRARAVEAAGELGALGVVERLRRDREPRVRLAALGVILEAGGELAAERARDALVDVDPAVQAVALEWLAANPVAPVDELRAPLADSGNRYMAAIGLNGVAALTARAHAEPRERGVIVAMLEQIGESWDYPVRRVAARALAELGRPEPPRGEHETDLGIRDYRELVRRTAEPRWVELETRHGRLVLELDCPVAPLTCESFAQLVGQGFYDGLEFHRLVPDFVAQAGDPRGDGWGGPGYTLRDEPSRLPFERGTVGMALSGPDTAGSQFFITLSAQPHLEGAFTVLGSVVAGDAVLDRLEQGDVIERAREVPAP